MVKKLIKHEIIAFSRTILPIYIILLGIAALTRFVQLFETDSVTYTIISVSSIVMLCVAIVVCQVMTLFTGITRFYKNLFTNEGYLSLTLPVSASHHIFAKLLVAIGFNILSVAAIIVSVFTATLGDVAHEIVKAVVYLIDNYFKIFGIHGGFYVLEIIVLLLISSISGYLLFYACISIGQLAKKNRVLAAFGAYFGYYIISQILGTVLVIVFSAFVDTSLYENIYIYFYYHQRETVHILLCFFAVYYAVLGFIYYLITYKIMTKKLNIE